MSVRGRDQKEIKTKENEEGGIGERRRLEEMLQLVVFLRSGGGDWSDAHNACNARVSSSGVVATATNMNVESSVRRREQRALGSLMRWVES